MLCKFLFLDRRTSVVYHVRDGFFYQPECLMAFPETLGLALEPAAVVVVLVVVEAVKVLP